MPESSVEEARDRLAGLLPDDALQDALEGLRPEEITGPGGLMSQLAGQVLETALGAELTGHLGYPPGQAPPGGAGNHRNGHTAKTVQTDLEPVQLCTPRDRAGTFGRSGWPDEPARPRAGDAAETVPMRRLGHGDGVAAATTIADDAYSRSRGSGRLPSPRRLRRL